MISRSLVAGAVLAVCLPSIASAALVGVSDPGDSNNTGLGGVAEIIANPAFALDDNVTNDRMQGFDEAQGVSLGADLSVDGGTISAGSGVSSHMIFLNSGGTTLLEHFNVVWTFSHAILGVMSDGSGNLEAASTAELGAAGTTYPASGFRARGLERNGGCEALTDGYAIISPNQLCVSMRVTEPGDWIRVVTAVPVPAALPLMLTAFAGLGFAARRKRNKG